VLSVYSEITGGLLWSFEASSNFTSNIIVTVNKVIVATSSQTYVVDIESRESTVLSAGGTLSLSEGILFVSDGQTITAFNVDGDNDEDGMWNTWELSFGLDPEDADDAALDLDEDGLSNFEEFEAETDPSLPDTDSDSLTDFSEVNDINSNPNLPDTDEDGLADGEEVNEYQTSPILFDSDGDGFSDGSEILFYETDPNDINSIPDSITTLNEPFEGESIPILWVTVDGSSADWLIDSTGGTEGSQALRSGDITDSQTSSVEFSGLFAAGTISFDYKISSESCCDSLEFYIDGERVLKSVTTSWMNESFNLTEGVHVLEWRYEKDGSVSIGEDTAWIDNVLFSVD
jgi:hypothetical protein